MKLLITGGCGFIGSALVKKLVQLHGDKCDLRVFDNNSVGQRHDLPDSVRFTDISVEDIRKQPEGLEFVYGDVCCKESMDSACIGIDRIVHLAANTGVGPSVENPAFDFENNVLGTFIVLDSARRAGVKKFVFASSGAPVGEVDPPIHEEIPAHPVSPYGASKLAGEGYCSAYFNSFGVDTVVLRFGNVFGPGSYNKNSVVAKFISAALRNEDLNVYGDGLQTRDFIYIDDLVSALVLAATTDSVGGETFQIATSRETSVAEIIEHIKKSFIAKKLLFPTVNYKSERVGDVRRNYSDTTKAKLMLNWSPETPIQTGIDRTLEYFLKISGNVQ